MFYGLNIFGPNILLLCDFVTVQIKLIVIDGRLVEFKTYTEGVMASESPENSILIRLLIKNLDNLRLKQLISYFYYKLDL